MRFLLFATLIFSSVSFQSSQASEGYLSTVREISDQIEFDKELVSDPKHATKLYAHEGKARRSLLIIHGLYESPFYMQGFATHFHSQGVNVLSVRLPGHLTKNSADISSVTHGQWIAAVERAFGQAQQLGEQVEVLGYSTGGVLGAYLALKYPAKVKALYLVAPALALSNRVFLASLVLGWTNMDLTQVCSPVDMDSMACRMVMHTDEQLEYLLREGLNPAPAAGFEVQNLINKIIRDYAPNGQNPQDYYRALKATYLRLRVPLVMVNSASDNVINDGFNHSLMKNYQGPNRVLYFPQSAKISHLMINKSMMDAYQNAPQTLNPQFQKILDLFGSLNP